MVQLTKEEIINMQIKRIEKEIRDTPYHKATEHHIGKLRAKLSKLKDDLENKSSGGGGGGGGYAVKKQGDATITLVGPPSVGKSTLINKLTNAQSKVAPYAFTTLTVIPGMMNFKDTKIQILDVPGLIEGAEIGKGRGKEVISVIRGSDLLLIMCDIDNLTALKSIPQTLEESGIRINKTKPNVTIEKKLKGGINVISNFKQEFSKDTVKEIAKEFRLPNAEITIKEKLTLDQLIDSFSPNRVYLPALLVINKVDTTENNKLESLYQSTDLKQYIKKSLKISAEKEIGLDELKENIWKNLNFIRIYLVRSDEKPSFANPIIMKKGQILSDVAQKIGEEFALEKTKAKIWGTGAKFSGQEVSLSKEIQEGMQVRFI